MGSMVWRSLLVLLFQASVLQRCSGVSVRFSNRDPVYVQEGLDLILEAEIQPTPVDSVATIRWERGPDGVKDHGRSVLLVEFPDQVSGERVSVEENGRLLKLLDFRSSDGGVYTVTVTDRRGGQSSAQLSVWEYEAVHHVSVMVNVSHLVLHCSEAWGTEPVFRWLYENRAVTGGVGRVSADGASLYLKTKLCGLFTCVVSNKLGYSSGTYTADPCVRQNSGMTVGGVVCLVLLLLLAGCLAFLFWRRRRVPNRRERFWNRHEDAT